MLGWVFVGVSISGGFTSDLAFQVQDYDPIPVSSATNRPDTTHQSSLNQTLLTNTPNVTVSVSESINPAPEEKEKFKHVMEWAIDQHLHEQPMGDIIQAIAHQFVGTPYKAGLLDQSPDETLVVTLQEFDCVLFVETVLAIARTVAPQDYSYPSFVNHLRDQRYQNGQLNGYCSRLHYFSAWIDDNEKRGTVKNITPALAGIPLNKPLNFMSTHRNRYPQLINNQENYHCILDMEERLKAIPLTYIPTAQIHHSYNLLQSGDIIGVATAIAGLDVTHTGFIERQPDGRIRLIHASPAGEVTISQDLQQYVSNIQHAIGILVVRPNDWRE